MIAPDEMLMAYVDDELPRHQRRAVEAWLARDEAARHDAAMFRLTAQVARLAYERPLWLTPPSAPMCAIAALPAVGLWHVIRMQLCNRRQALAAGGAAALVLALLFSGLWGQAGPARSTKHAVDAGATAPASGSAHQLPASRQATTTDSKRPRQ